MFEMDEVSVLGTTAKEHVRGTTVMNIYIKSKTHPYNPIQIHSRLGGTRLHGHKVYDDSQVVVESRPKSASVLS